MALEETAARLIQKHGRPVSIRQSSRTADDADKPWGSASTTTTDTPTFGAFFRDGAGDLEARLSAVSRLVLSPVEADESLVYIPGTVGVAPTIADQLVDGSRVMEIKKVETVKPGNTVFLYILKVEN